MKQLLVLFTLICLIQGCDAQKGKPKLPVKDTTAKVIAADSLQLPADSIASISVDDLNKAFAAIRTQWVGVDCDKAEAAYKIAIGFRNQRLRKKEK